MLFALFFMSGTMLCAACLLAWFTHRLGPHKGAKPADSLSNGPVWVVDPETGRHRLVTVREAVDDVSDEDDDEAEPPPKHMRGTNHGESWGEQYYG